MKKILGLLLLFVMILCSWLFYFQFCFKKIEILVVSQTQNFQVFKDGSSCKISTSTGVSQCDAKKVISWARILLFVNVEKSLQGQGPEPTTQTELVLKFGSAEKRYLIMKSKDISYLRIADSAGYTDNKFSELVPSLDDLILLPDINDKISSIKSVIINEKEIPLNSQQKIALNQILSYVKPDKPSFIGLPTEGDLYRLTLGQRINENIKLDFVINVDNLKKKITFGRPHLTESKLLYWIEGETVVVESKFSAWSELAAWARQFESQ